MRRHGRLFGGYFDGLEVAIGEASIERGWAVFFSCKKHGDEGECSCVDATYYTYYAEPPESLGKEGFRQFVIEG